MNIPTRRELLKAGLAIAGGNLSLGLPGALYAYAAPIGADTNGQRFYSGALPARSDVVMSTRSFHPDALNQLKAFQATRNEWFYTTDAAYFAEMKKLVKHVGLSTSTTTRHPNMPTPNDLRANRFAPQASGVSRDIDGSVTVAPWMVTSETAWNSMFNADTRAAIMASVKVAVGIGADSLQVDDPAMEYAVTQWAGGDFSPEALSAFRAYCQSSPAARGLRDLAAVDFDMSRWVKSRAGTATHINWGEFKKVHGSDPAWLVWTTFMKITTQNFISSIRQYLYSQPRPLPISLNALPVPTANETYLLDCADYLISEIYHLLWPRQLAAYHACAAAWKLPLLPSILPITTADCQWAIALAYAFGDNPLVPWNMYVPNQPRYFGTVADYGSLFSFVRANAQYFDDFEEIADVMLVVDEDSATLDTLPGAAQVCLDLGAAFRLSVLRPNSVTGNHSAPFNPQAVVAVNCPTSNVTTLFPGVPVRALSDLQANGSDPALKRVIRTITPDPQRIVAVPRINRRSGVLLIHVVDATKSSEGFRSAQYLDIMVPKPYWPYFKGIQHALLVRPNGDPAKRPLSITQDSETMKIRAPLSGISGWGILVFDRNMA